MVYPPYDHSSPENHFYDLLINHSECAHGWGDSSMIWITSKAPPEKIKKNISQILDFCIEFLTKSNIFQGT